MFDIFYLPLNINAKSRMFVAGKSSYIKDIFVHIIDFIIQVIVYVMQISKVWKYTVKDVKNKKMFHNMEPINTAFWVIVEQLI